MLVKPSPQIILMLKDLQDWVVSERNFYLTLIQYFIAAQILMEYEFR